MSTDSLIEEIKQAFSGVQLEDGIGLWEAQAIDDYESEDVQKKQRNLDEKNDWSLLKSSDLQRCHSSLSFFNANGMRFHLPAFLIGNIRNEIDDPIFHLTQLDDYTTSQLTTLSSVQRKAVLAYLNWCLSKVEYEYEHIAIRKAIERYWRESER